MKKLFISADIEGSAGISHWDETNLNDVYFRTVMTNEAAAACRGAFDAGFGEVVIKDAHDSARNIFPEKLPRGVSVIRNWTGDPWCMVGGMDESFDAAAFTGYHAPAFSDGSPLSHTLSTSLMYLKLNGEYASEFTINAYACAVKGVPVAFVSGDEYLCETAKNMIPGIVAVPVNKSIGGASVAPHPEVAREKIKDGVFRALTGDYGACVPKLPAQFELEAQYKKREKAYHAQFFPGARLVNPHTVAFAAEDLYPVLVFLHFCA